MPDHEQKHETAEQGETIFFGPEMPLRVKIANVAVLCLLAVCAVTFVWAMSSLPRIEGRIPASGLEYPASVSRDKHGVTAISARTGRDAYYVLGWVHAQDRLWQMELQRRIGAGRLAEIFGAPGLNNDRFMRTLGLHELAENSFAALDAPTRNALTAYAEGVNAWIKGNLRMLPPEFTVLGLTPEPWTPADSLVWGRLMALRLTADWRDDVLQARLNEILPAEALRDLWPQTKPKKSAAAAGPAEKGPLFRLLPATALPMTASNAAAVSADRSGAKGALVANDPHLPFQAPSLWHLSSIQAPGLRITGAAVPGVPFHLIGQTDRIAWGITAAHADTLDIFQERGVDAERYMSPTGPKPFGKHTETIKVKDSDDVVLNVRTTDHGPVVTEFIHGPASAEILTMRSTALNPQDSTAQALYKLNRAVDWRTIQSALSEFQAPVQNFVFGDSDGNVGMITAGLVPTRRGGDGTGVPQGWTGKFDWDGWIPYSRMPQSISPADGLVFNANNPPPGASAAFPIAAKSMETWRAERMADVLESKSKIDSDDLAAMQSDMLSLPALLVKQALGRPAEAAGAARKSADLVAKWDGAMDRNRPEPLIYHAWREALEKRVFADDLGEDFAAFAPARPEILLNALQSSQYDWCDDRKTATTETCTGQIAAALHDATTELSGKFGIDPTKWRWGAVHQARFVHPVLTHVPFLRGMADHSIATDGDNHTLNRGAFRFGDFSHVHGPGLRVIFDVAEPANSRYSLAMGQSGNPLSRRYDDMLEDWADNRYFQIEPPDEHAATIRLEPAR